MQQTAEPNTRAKLPSADQATQFSVLFQQLISHTDRMQEPHSHHLHSKSSQDMPAGIFKDPGQRLGLLALLHLN